MMARRWIFQLLILSSALSANGQYNKEFKRIFFDAQQLFESGFYEESYNRFSNLLALDPGNSNMLYHCGTLCLYIQGKEREAIPYLGEALKGVYNGYKPNNYKETGAPVYAYYLLGRAYHLNNQYDSAIENYLTYLDRGENEDPEQLEFAELQLNACERAKKQMGMEPGYRFQDLMDFFDDETHSCSNPVISGDGTLFIYLVDYPSDKKIMMSTKEEDGWTRPRNINREIGMVGETYPVSLSYDGKELYLAHHFYSHSDIYVSTYSDGRWSGVVPLGPNVNGRTSETHASISRDGETLYFTSNRRGGRVAMTSMFQKGMKKGSGGLPQTWVL